MLRGSGLLHKDTKIVFSGFKKLVGACLFSGLISSSVSAHAYYQETPLSVEAEKLRDSKMFEDARKFDDVRGYESNTSTNNGFIVSDPRFDDFRSEVEQGKSQNNDFVSIQHMKSAHFYILSSVNSVFDNVDDFECVGNNRAAECRVSNYDLVQNVSLKNFRYTVDYKDARVIERISGNLKYNSEGDVAVFFPKDFECLDFTEIHSDKKSINEQLSCKIKSQFYELDFRIRSVSKSQLFKNQDAMKFMLQTSEFLDKMSSVVGSKVNDGDETYAYNQDFDNLVKTLSKINTNVYGLEISLKKPNLPQKMYEYLFADMLELENDGEISQQEAKRYNQLSKTLYNSGVGYIYGSAMGYVIGNDKLDLRTKDGLLAALTALRDSAMLDSRVSRVTIKLTNRTKKGVNLGKAFKFTTEKLEQFNNTEIKKENAGKAVNVFSGDLLNRYRIEVGVYRFR